MSCCNVSEVSRATVASWVVIGLVCLGPQLGAQQPEPSDYMVGAQDELLVTVFDEPDLTKIFTVDDDGTITLPLVGRVEVDGLTLREIRDEITRQLGDGFLVSPQVSVEVAEYRSQSVYVLGEVANPGIYSLSGNLSLLRVLAQAGSTTAQAGNVVQIIRSVRGRASGGPVVAGDDETKMEVVSLSDIRTGRLTLVTIRDGDTVNVPKAAVFFVSGHVASPGSYVWAPGTTVRQAIALAGGYASRGSNRGIRVIREVDGSQATVSVNENDPVLAGDVIEIRARRF